MVICQYCLKSRHETLFNNRVSTRKPAWILNLA
nr:MAG TPA: hypothetical protein [Caudoviricetes sp.]